MHKLVAHKHQTPIRVPDDDRTNKIEVPTQVKIRNDRNRRDNDSQVKRKPKDSRWDAIERTFGQRFFDLVKIVAGWSAVFFLSHYALYSL